MFFKGSQKLAVIIASKIEEENRVLTLEYSSFRVKKTTKVGQDRCDQKDERGSEKGVNSTRVFEIVTPILALSDSLGGKIKAL